MLLVGLAATGCASEPDAKPLGADQFYRPVDRAGAIVPGAQPAAAPPPVTAAGGVSQESAKQLDFVSTQIKPSATQPTTSATPAAWAPGQYTPLGGVIAEVNGNPIYADDILRQVSSILSARAKDLDIQAFRNLAGSEINRQVDEEIRAQVEFAAAERNVSAEEKTLAENITMQWRDKLITDSKGSIEEARRRVREDQGRSLDDLAKEQYRVNLVRVYYTKKLFPRIQVTADDLRRYYEKNKDAFFTERDNITFRLIKITSKDLGTSAAAEAKVNELSARAARGEDFATIAGEINNDPMLLRTKGLTGPIDRGAFKLEAVETALWKLNPGAVTPVVRIDDDFYIARLDEKKLGRVKAFEEDDVQRRMLETLRGEQFTTMRRDMETQLRKDSVVSKNQQMFATAVDMAVANYPKWK